MIQSLIAIGESPTSALFTKGSADPVSALLSFQLTSGTGTGAFFFPPAPAPANIIATYQAIPALAGLTFPFGPSGRSYWEVATDGGVFSFGGAGFYGSMGGTPLNKPVVGVASTPGGQGYWEAASDGGIFSFGDAGFFRVDGGYPAQQAGGRCWRRARSDRATGRWPPTAASSASVTPASSGRWAASPSTNRWWAWPPLPTAMATGWWPPTAASSASVTPASSGSMGGKPLNQPVVGMAATPDGRGYWLVASDGGVFSFGDAGFFGSMGGKPLNQPVVGMAATPDGRGYWLVASDGGVFSFGDAGFFGSMGGKPLNQPVVGMAASLSRPA